MADADFRSDHEPAWRSQNNDDARDARRDLVTQSPWLTPYLGLRARLSQVWLNRWTILILLVLVRTLFAVADLEDKINDARADAMSSCTSMENVGSTIASAPHYMASGVNELTAHGVEKAIDGLMSMLSLTITGVEEVVVFAINLYTQTYLCLITLAISGSLHVALSVIEDVTHFLNETIGAIGKDLHSAIDDFDSGLNKAITGFDKLFGAKVPQLNVGSDLDKLDHLQLPAGLDQGLQKLNSSIPNFGEVNNLTQTALRFPFEELKKLVANHTGHYTFNRSLFPVPGKEKISFCSSNDGINDFFNGLIDVEVTAKKVAIAVLVILAVAVIGPMTWWEIQRWKMMQKKAHYLNEHAFDSLDAVYVVSRPYSSMVGIEVAKKATDDYRRRTLIRWCIAYCTSPPALFLLSLGLAGVFSGLCHYFTLRALTHEIPQLTQDVDAFADKIVSTVNNVSVKWANETNGVILDMSDRINHDVFGWVNISTSALNHTLNVATDEMIKALNVTFGGTILYDPIMEVYNCLIGLKVAGIEKALTWVQDHAHIDFPLLPNDTLSLSNAAQKGAAASGNSKANQAADLLSDANDEGTSAIKNAVNKLIVKVRKHIIQETIIAAVIVLVWVIVLLIGCGRILWLMFTPNKTRGEGGQMWPGWLNRNPSGSGGGATLGDRFTGARGKLSSLRTRFANRNNPPMPATYVEKVPEVDMREKRAPPTPSLSTNPFFTPKLPDYDEHARDAGFAEPTLPNFEDNNGSNFRGVDYTLQPRPFPAHPASPVARERMGSVSSSAVAPVVGHPRASWRPEVVGNATSPDAVAKAAGRSQRMDSLGMFAGHY